MSTNNITWIVNSSAQRYNFKDCIIYKEYLTDENIFNFNDLALLLTENELPSHISTPLESQDQLMESYFQVRNVHLTDTFSSLHSTLDDQFNTENLTSDSDIFFSYVKGKTGLAHKDPYDVCVVNLLGQCIYKIGDDVSVLNKGDLLYIPSGVEHFCATIEPRITLSYGVRGDIDRMYPWETETETNATAPAE